MLPGQVEATVEATGLVLWTCRSSFWMTPYLKVGIDQIAWCDRDRQVGIFEKVLDERRSLIESCHQYAENIMRLTPAQVRQLQ